ncbi:MAG: hypothetical protein NVS2B4_17920 [Ramlibacter sp.]
MPLLRSNRSAVHNARQHVPVPLTVSALELHSGRLTHLHGAYQGGQPWRLAVEDAVAAIEGRRYSLGVRSGRERCVLVRRDDAALRFQALDRCGNDVLPDVPVIVHEPVLVSSMSFFSRTQP